MYPSVPLQGDGEDEQQETRGCVKGQGSGVSSQGVEGMLCLQAETLPKGENTVQVVNSLVLERG